MADLRVTTSGGIDAVLEEAPVVEFKKSLRGPLIAPGDEAYEEARQIWNANIDRRPGLICRPAGVVVFPITLASVLFRPSWASTAANTPGVMMAGTATSTHSSRGRAIRRVSCALFTLL